MAKEKETQNGMKMPQMIVDNAHKLFLAGLGAVMMAQEEVTNMTQKFVAEGEEFEEKSISRFNEFVEARKKDTEKAGKRLEKNWNKQTENVLHGFNIPTRAEINKLNTKITKLTKMVDEMKKEPAK